MLQCTMIIALLLALVSLVAKDLYANHKVNKERCITAEEEEEEE